MATHDRGVSTLTRHRFQVVAPDGSSSSVLDAEGVLGGFLAAPVNATTTAGNDGFVVVTHQADQNVPATELVVFHLDPASHWNLVGRFPSTTPVEVVTETGSTKVSLGGEDPSC